MTYRIKSQNVQFLVFDPQAINPVKPFEHLKQEVNNYTTEEKVSFCSKQVPLLEKQKKKKRDRLSVTSIVYWPEGQTHMHACIHAHTDTDTHTHTYIQYSRPRVLLLPINGHNQLVAYSVTLQGVQQARRKVCVEVIGFSLL